MKILAHIGILGSLSANFAAAQTPATGTRCDGPFHPTLPRVGPSLLPPGWWPMPGLPQQRWANVRPLPAYTKSPQRLTHMLAAWDAPERNLQEDAAYAPLFGQVYDLWWRDGARLERTPEGHGGAYFLRDGHGPVRWVIKPVDEEIRCPNHALHWYKGPDEVHQRHKPDVPLLTAMQRELATDIVAEAWNLTHLRPVTLPVQLDFGRFLGVKRGGTANMKLCSAQQFVPRGMHVKAVVDTLTETLGREPPAEIFQRRAFQEATLLAWAIYDNDNNLRNVLAYVPGEPLTSVKAWLQWHLDQQLKRPLMLVKIDAGFAMPEANTELKNRLALLPGGNMPLDDALRERVLAQSEGPAVRAVQRRLRGLGLYPDGHSTAGRAYAERMERLRALVLSEPNITLRAINDFFNATQPPLRPPPEFANAAPGEET